MISLNFIGENFFLFMSFKNLVDSSFTFDVNCSTIIYVFLTLLGGVFFSYTIEKYSLMARDKLFMK